MNAINRMRLLTAVIVIGLISGVAPPIAAEKLKPAFSSDPAAIKSRLENVQRLVRTSSGAMRIKSGDSVEAKELQAKADGHLLAAEKAYDSGDMAVAQDELKAATSAMFSAIRKVGTGKSGELKKNREFNEKYESVDVLLNAVFRVSEEKGGLADVDARAGAIRTRTSAAKKLADAGKVDEARRHLDIAYEEAKLELEQLREGETLVRTLEFASDEEEYHYELDRNDTHQMLLKVLLEDQASKPGMQKLIDSYVGKSTELRSRAEGEASSGAYDQAVDSLEEATKYLQRAIRSAGVYIPG